MAASSTTEGCMLHDIDILRKMMRDKESVSHLFQPTNYWQFYERETIRYIESNGLHNFRSYSTSTLSAIGGSREQAPLSSWFPKKLLEFRGYRKSSNIARLFHVYSETVRLAESLAPLLRVLNIEDFLLPQDLRSLKDFEELLNEKYRHSKLLDEISGLQLLNSIEDSLIGCPYDKFEINGKAYTRAFLRVYDQMAYVARHININDIGLVLEIGSGYGASAEVYVKALPNVSYFCCDIPPQLYVAQQYLSAVFPGKVYTYENYVSGDVMDRSRYKVFCLPSWALENMPELDFGLFINSASFQEMEPEIVENYYRLIEDRIEYAYLFQLTHGTYKKSSATSGGSINPLGIDEHMAIFKRFELMHREEWHRIGNPYTHILMRNTGAKKPAA